MEQPNLFSIRRGFLTAVFLACIVVLSSYTNSQWRKHYSNGENCFCKDSATKTSTPARETEVKRDGMWTVNSINRLGNQMNGYGALYAFAKMNGKQPYILSRMHSYLAPIFKITIPVIHDSVAQKIQWKGFHPSNWMREEYKTISGKYVKITGDPWSWTWYRDIRDEIRREFTLHDFLRDGANEQLAKLKGSRTNVTFVGVHVRRGDYVVHMPRDWKGAIGDRAYLQEAMDYFRKKYQEPIFVVASNGMPWCKENINASNGDVYFAGDSNESTPANDFALLVQCNHTIMTIGTFGWWAGYLAGGEVVYLTNFTSPKSKLPHYFHYKDTYLPEWIGIAADLTPLINDRWKTMKGWV
ncbi:galactoside alpha-(1,2)-fucosyltransferase 2-like [Ambystoma mexicanum]|uniref:galactoside alpha-(1,2)-fucosyltransferase 2-like n=1 Tax=Ambystoma mexicanum TaxID=8296 RepID=UPI0037E8ECE4